MTSTLCPTCSCRIPPHAPEGLCPRCLVSAGLVGSLGTQPAAQAAELLSVEELGELLPHREVEALIGRGGMGAVYLARDPRLGRRLAIKVLSGELAADPAFVERFAREARAVARLEHPNVVQIHQFVDDPDLPYLELEYVSGQNLRELLRGGPLRLDRAREILRQVAAGLAYAHREGVVHRDVKPENVLVDEDGRVRLVDFGLAKLTSDTRSLTLTGAQQVVGTVHYMAPEQLESPETVDARSDVYSWGVIAYEVLAGRLPLGRFGPPSRYAEVGPELDAIVLQALEREPEDRFADGGQLRSRLEGVGGAIASREIASDPSPESLSGDSSSVSWGLIALALVVAFGLFVLAIVVLFLFLGARPSPPRVQAPQPAPRRSLPAPSPRSPALTEAEERAQEQARLEALEAGVRLQSRIAASQPKLAESAERLSVDDGVAAYREADEAARILAEGERDLKLLLAAPEGEAAYAKARGALREAREAALCARVLAAVAAPSELRVERARQDLKQLFGDRKVREDSSNRVLHASGELRLLLGEPVAAAEDFRVWRAREPANQVAALGLGRALFEGDEPARALEVLEAAWGDPKHPLVPKIQEVALDAALELAQSEDLERWLGRLPTSRTAPYAGLLRARAKASQGDLFGGLDELRGVLPLLKKAPEGRARLHHLAAEVFLAYELPGEVRAQAALLRSIPGWELRADLWEALADSAEVLPEAEAKLRQVVARAGSWQWREKALAWRVLAQGRFEEGDPEAARSFAKRAHLLNTSERESLICLARVQTDPHFDGQYLDDALELCREARRRRETFRLLGIQAWITLQQFPYDPSRSQRIAKSVPALLARPLVLDLRDRGSPSAGTSAVRRRLRRAERQVSHFAARAAALGQRFEHEAGAERDPAARKPLRARAKRAYRRALWHYPFHLGARLGLARVAQAEGDLSAALAAVKVALREHPQARAALAASARLAPYDPKSKELAAAYVKLSQDEIEDSPTFQAVGAGLGAQTAWTQPPMSPEQRLELVEKVLAGFDSEETTAIKAQVLRGLAEELRSESSQAAAKAEARADQVEAEFKAKRLERSRRLRPLLRAVRNQLENKAFEAALVKAREACALAPDEGAAWAAYASVCLAARRLPEALRASACAAWISDEYLPGFMICAQLTEHVPQGSFGKYPALPRVAGLRSFLATLSSTLGGATNAELTRRVGQELGRLGQLYPTKLASSCFWGSYLSDRGKFERAMVPLFYAARVHPDLPPLPGMAGVAAAGLPEGPSRTYGDTLAILSLRRAKELGMTWREDLIPQRLRGKKRLWDWLERPFDLSK